LEDLKEISSNLIQSNVQMDSLMATLLVAEKLEDQDLKKKTLQYIEE
jgi:hypothetical protein